MNNREFLNSIKQMYEKYLDTHRRSSEKLKPFHGMIAEDLQNRLGENYKVFSLGYEAGKEKTIEGKYMDKKVDISIFKKNGRSLDEIGGIALKSIMTNYAQNSNNYFENMLGETANLRSNSKLYFQILVLPEIMPYFGNKTINGVEKKDVVKKNETLNVEKLSKYVSMSNDNIDNSLFLPNKTLLYLINTHDTQMDISNYPTRSEWVSYMKQNLNIKLSSQNLNFGEGIIYNNYESFIQAVVQKILED